MNIAMDLQIQHIPEKTRKKKYGILSIRKPSPFHEEYCKFVGSWPVCNIPAHKYLSALRRGFQQARSALWFDIFSHRWSGAKYQMCMEDDRRKRFNGQDRILENAHVRG